MSYRILTEAEYEIFAASERDMYPMGFHAWSDVRDRDQSDSLAMLWDDAMAYLEMLPEEDGGEDPDYNMSEAGRRVAVAHYYTFFGELPKNADERKAVVKDGRLVN